MIKIKFIFTESRNQTIILAKPKHIIIILIFIIMEEIVRNPGLQHIIEKSLTLLNIWDIASVKSVNQDFRKIVHSHEVISIISAGKHSC